MIFFLLAKDAGVFICEFRVYSDTEICDFTLRNKCYFVSRNNNRIGKSIDNRKQKTVVSLAFSCRTLYV